MSLQLKWQILHSELDLLKLGELVEGVSEPAFQPLVSCSSTPPKLVKKIKNCSWWWVSDSIISPFNDRGSFLDVASQSNYHVQNMFMFINCHLVKAITETYNSRKAKQYTENNERN